MKKINNASKQAKGLVGAWDFDDFGFAIDQKTKAKGIITGATSAPGRISRALKFSAAGQYVRCPTVSGTVPTGNMTMCAWINPLSLADRGILSYQDSYNGSSHDKQIYIDSTGKVAFYVYNSGKITATGTTTLSAAKWYFVCGMVESQNGSSVWVNGVKEGVNAGGTNSQSYSGDFFIGALTNLNDSIAYNDFDGSIDEVRLYNRALSQAEINDIYVNGRALYKKQSSIIYKASIISSTHATTGALSTAGATLAGTSAHVAVHGSTGVLSNSGATLAGASTRFRAFSTSGVLSNSGATLAGAADHTAPGGTHDTTGALSTTGATLAGTSAHVAIHGTTGALSNSGATLAGTASNFTVHATTGAMTADAAVLSGTALHSFAVTHATTGALAGWGAEITGAAINGTVVLDQHFSGNYGEQGTKKKKRKLKASESFETPESFQDEQGLFIADALMASTDDNSSMNDAQMVKQDEQKIRYKILAAAALLTAH